MDVVNKIIVGAIQGISELLPISSSGHLFLSGELLGIEIDLTLLTFLHLMTGLAIAIGFRREIREIFEGVRTKIILKNISIAILPSIILGFILIDYIEKYLHGSILTIVIGLIFWGLIMIFVDQIFFSKESSNRKEMGDITMRDAVIIGFAQILALIPGTSRSAITIMPGIMLGFKRQVAITYSFLIGLPLIIGVFFFEIIREPQSFTNILNTQDILAGIVSFVLALVTIKVLKKIANIKFLAIFGVYRIIIAILVLLTIII